MEKIEEQVTLKNQAVISLDALSSWLKAFAEIKTQSYFEMSFKLAKMIDKREPGKFAIHTSTRNKYQGHLDEQSILFSLFLEELHVCVSFRMLEDKAFFLLNSSGKKVIKIMKEFGLTHKTELSWHEAYETIVMIVNEASIS